MEKETVRQRGISQSILTPIAIIIGFGLIAAAIYFSGLKSGEGEVVKNTGDNTNAGTAPSLEAINPVTEDDHIRGNPNAQIVLVEYSDYDCPFCKNFHETMKRIMADYGTDGKIAWVYRQFPIAQLHPSAPHIAESAECVASLGGNEAFWAFSDQIFEERETNEQTDITRLSEFAVAAGVSKDEFESCLDSGEQRSAVEEDYNNAQDIGARGTPHTVILVGDEQGLINGAQPYAVVKEIIDNLLKGIEAGTL